MRETKKKRHYGSRAANDLIDNARKEGSTTPIVTLTANAMKGDDKKCLEAGCDDYLAKPIDRKDLREVISKYLQPCASEALPADT
ncbi:MAG: response regulator [Phycisphaerae bacterium]|nr:response regulator [Phycisphaerae bacterium]